MNIATKTLIVSAAVALLGIGVWFASSLQRTLPPNSNSTAVSNSGNTNANGNMNAGINGNTNGEISNSLVGRVDQLTFSYPSSWKLKAIVGDDNCVGLSSPELEEYNKNFRKSNPNVDATDAVVTEDVMICVRGDLTSTLENAAKQEIGGEEATVVEAPFPGALKYSLNIIRPFDLIFLERQGKLVSITIQSQPYQNSLNAQKIVNILKSIK